MECCVVHEVQTAIVEGLHKMFNFSGSFNFKYDQVRTYYQRVRRKQMVTGASSFHVDVVVPTLRANVESSKYEKERSRMRRYMLRLEIAANFLALLLLACVWSHTWFDFVIILAPTVGFWYFVISR